MVYNTLKERFYMPYKDPEKQRAAQHQHYLKNKDLFRERLRKRRKDCKTYAHKIKSQKGCSQCGEKDSVCLDFHHNNSDDKTCTIAQKIVNGGMSSLKQEIKKCSVLCSNCHRKKHITGKVKYNPNIPNFQLQKRKWYIEFKKTLCCKNCNENDPIVLEFHHRNPDTKLFNICKHIYNGTSVIKVLSEIEKCDVLCSNCHRKHHG